MAPPHLVTASGTAGNEQLTLKKKEKSGKDWETDRDRRVCLIMFLSVLSWSNFLWLQC